ncbi:MAG: WXG100 family type VII secretion target [Kibdelosporangium sp.]
MKDGFLTDHERLAQHAGDFAGLAERATAIAGELNRNLDALGQSWGTDDVGQSFSAVYTGPSQETRRNIDAASGRLGDMGDRLTAMAAAYRDVDAAAARGLDPRSGAV